MGFCGVSKTFRRGGTRLTEPMQWLAGEVEVALAGLASGTSVPAGKGRGSHGKPGCIGDLNAEFEAAERGPG